jgi:hypothetical protein
MVGKKTVLMLVLLSLGLVAATFHPAQSVKRATIDFSGLAEGAIVSSLSHGAGISGDPIKGSVSVFGSNPAFPGTNTAMIFDATCAGGCSGQDFDLHFPELGNVLIISEDLDSNDPDDADNPGAFFRFDFSKFGPGKVNVKSLVVADIEIDEGAMVQVFQPGQPDPKTVDIPFTGDHNDLEVQVGGQGIDRMVVFLGGSGAIDNIEIEIEDGNGPEINLELDGTCVPKGVYSEKLELTGTLKRDGVPIPNHAISLNLPNGNKVSVNTNQDGAYSYLFEGARDYIGQNVAAVATVDGNKFSAQHAITASDFEGCNPPVQITLQGTCEPYENERSDDLRLWGDLTLGGSPVPNHTIRLDFPDGNSVSLNTDTNGEFWHIYKGARNYIGQNITAVATVDGNDYSAQHAITEDDFEDCSPGVNITLQGTCEPQGQPSIDLRLTGDLTRDGNPIPNHPVRLNLPDGSEVQLSTNQEGKISYLFKGAARFLGSNITAVARVDGVDYPAQHKITEENFKGCPIRWGPELTVQGICEKKTGQSESHDLRLTGKLTDFDGSPVPNHTIELDLPDREELVFVTTGPAGNYSYLFVGADQYLGKRVKAETTFEGERIFAKEDHIITDTDFKGCQKTRSYKCKKVLLTTYHEQPIELGSQIPGWGLVNVNLECIGRGQGKSCRLVVKGQPGYLIKSDTLKMNVPRLEPHVKYQAQIKGYDGAWTNKGCEFSFITGGRVASTSTHLADQVDQLGWVSLGEGQNAIKPLGVCSGWSDACLFADNIIGFHLDDIYGNRQPGAELSALQPGDRISIYRDHRLYTYEFTGSERVRQSAEGNQSILDAAELHDLVLTTCSGYWLIDEGHFSHTRLATFTLLPRIERLYLGH